MHWHISVLLLRKYTIEAKIIDVKSPTYRLEVNFHDLCRSYYKIAALLKTSDHFVPVFQIKLAFYIPSAYLSLISVLTVCYQF